MTPGEKKNIDELILEKSRIKGIEILAEENENLNSGMNYRETEKTLKSHQKKTIIIGTAIISAVIITVFVLVTFVFKKPQIGSDMGKDSIPFETDNKSYDAQSDNKHIIRGKESYLKGYMTDAVAEFNEALESDASNKDKAIALIYLAIISDSKSKYDEAITFLNRAQNYDKKNPDIYKNLAIVYRHKKDYGNAIKYTKETLSLNNRDPGTITLLGNIYFETGKYKDAIEQYNEALKSNPENGAIIYNLGSAHFRDGDEFSAIEYYKKAGSVDRIGDVAHKAYSKLGVIFTERRSFDEAEKYLKMAISIRPNDALNRYNLGIAYLRQKKEKPALEEFIKSEELGANDAAMLENVAEAFFSVKDFDRSLNVYEKLYAVNSRNVKILSRMGEIYYEKGELDKAYQVFKRITTIEPATENARVAYINMGNILDDMQRFDESIEAYKASLAISPKDDSALYNLGIAYKHAGKPELAVEAWKNASSLNRDDPKPLLAMADFYYEKNFYDLAERTYQDLISKWPRVQEAHFKMATIYYKRDQYEYALKAYKRVIELDEKNDMARRAYINIAVLSSKTKHDEESANESIRMIQKALLIKPDDPEALFSLGLLYFHKEMYDKAVDTFYQALKGARESALIAQSYNNIGKSYYKKKNYKKALQAFTRAVDEDSSNEEIRLNRKTAMQAYEQEMALSR